MSNKAKIREDAMSLNPMDDALFQKICKVVHVCWMLNASLKMEELLILRYKERMMMTINAGCVTMGHY